MRMPTLPLTPKLSFQQLFAGPRVARAIGRLDAFFIKLPHLPKKVQLFLKTIVPFIALAFGIIGLLATVLGVLFLLLALIAGDWWLAAEMLPSMLAVFFSMLFLLKAFRPLRRGDAVGWIYLFWAALIEAGHLVARLISGDGEWYLGLISLLLTLYVLFEIGQFFVYGKINISNTTKPTEVNV